MGITEKIVRKKLAELGVRDRSISETDRAKIEERREFVRREYPQRLRRAMDSLQQLWNDSETFRAWIEKTPSVILAEFSECLGCAGASDIRYCLYLRPGGLLEWWTRDFSQGLTELQAFALMDDRQQSGFVVMLTSLETPTGAIEYLFDRFGARDVENRD